MSEQTAFIEVKNLSKVYGLFSKFRALDDVNLNIAKGETFGLIGPNGAGKTTLMGCLLGLLRPSTGSMSIDGKSVNDISVRVLTGFVPERPNFDAWMIVENFLHYHHMLAQQPKENAQEDVAQALVDVGLQPEIGKRLIRKLSRGMLQRLGLAQLIVGKPQICFLDEPTSGVDPLGMSLVRDLLFRWKREGKTVIINSHHLDQVEKVCDRVAFIQGGKIKSIEELVPTARSKQAFMIRWGVLVPSSELITKIAQENQIECQAIKETSAHFLLSAKSESSKLLKAFIQADIQIEEALYEQKDLVELFKKDRE
jgi:ABC-2 type transport system ATP-binding protein